MQIEKKEQTRCQIHMRHIVSMLCVLSIAEVFESGHSLSAFITPSGKKS